MVMISLNTAPVSDVITAIELGIAGISFFMSSANKPSVSSFFFNSSNAFRRAPSPKTSICLTLNWYLPDGA